VNATSLRFPSALNIHQRTLHCALISDQTNCLTVCMFEDAIARAQELDRHLDQTGNPVGPLHGLPVSLKDNFHVKGYDTTVGFVSWANDPAKYDATIVEVLRDAGAVLYCKTNVPTAMYVPQYRYDILNNCLQAATRMIAESVNNLFGRTVNPRNRLLTSGGSSGGESALIAFGGSCLGVGTDIGKYCEDLFKDSSANPTKGGLCAFQPRCRAYLLCVHPLVGFRCRVRAPVWQVRKLSTQ
jgi:Asp-tRNA(Asn)/Glu-tRNA(Gln) amidotransferase A subunit family amidase